MSYDNNWSGGGTRDKGLTEIAVLLVLLVFVLFGLLFYFFYLRVSDLGEQNAVLTERIAALESRLERSIPPAPAYTEKWSPPDPQQRSDEETEAAKATQKAPFTNLSGVAPKKVDTLRVRPDGKVIGSTPKDEGGSDRKATRMQGAQARKASHTEVDIEKCWRDKQIVFCDLVVSTQSDDNRKIVIHNKDSFASGYDQATYRVSSFQIGVLGDRKRFRSTAFFSSNMPLPVQFQFYGVSADVAVFKTVQFNIDGRTFAFEDLKIGEPEAPGWQIVKTSASAKRSGAGPVRQKKTAGDITVDLQHCTARKKKVFCDLRLTNLGRSARQVVISKDKTFARSQRNTVRRFTSFSLLASDEVHHHHTRAYLKKERPQVVRFHLFDPLPTNAGYKSMQFNIDGQTIVFEDVAIGS